MVFSASFLGTTYQLSKASTSSERRMTSLHLHIRELNLHNSSVSRFLILCLPFCIWITKHCIVNEKFLNKKRKTNNMLKAIWLKVILNVQNLATNRYIAILMCPWTLSDPDVFQCFANKMFHLSFIDLRISLHILFGKFPPGTKPLGSIWSGYLSSLLVNYLLELLSPLVDKCC